MELKYTQLNIYVHTHTLPFVLCLSVIIIIIIIIIIISSSSRGTLGTTISSSYYNYLLIISVCLYRVSLVCLVPGVHL